MKKVWMIDAKNKNSYRAMRILNQLNGINQYVRDLMNEVIPSNQTA